MIEENLVDEQSIGKTQLLYPVLLSCQLVRDAEEDEDEEKESNRFYDATIKPVTISESLNVALCQFSAGQTEGELTTLKFEAIYYVAFRANGTQPSEGGFRELMVQTASVSAWPLFRALYSQVVSQANEDLPALPAEPSLTWQKMDDDSTE
jgi:hypothetical protein